MVSSWLAGRICVHIGRRNFLQDEFLDLAPYLGIKLHLRVRGSKQVFLVPRRDRQVYLAMAVVILKVPHYFCAAGVLNMDLLLPAQKEAVPLAEIRYADKGRAPAPELRWFQSLVG